MLTVNNVAYFWSKSQDGYVTVLPFLEKITYQIRKARDVINDFWNRETNLLVEALAATYGFTKPKTISTELFEKNSSCTHLFKLDIDFERNTPGEDFDSTHATFTHRYVCSRCTSEVIIKIRSNY
jgi:hypothetical protein